MATQDYLWNSRSDGGPQTSEPAWSSFMNTYNYGGNDGEARGADRTISWQVIFNNTGYQQFWSAVDDYGILSIDGYAQVAMGGYTGRTLIQTPDVIIAGEHTVQGQSVNSGGFVWGVALQWAGFVSPPPPTIQYFTADPNPQTSGTIGVPSDASTLSWSTYLNYNTVPRNALPSSVSIDQGIGTVSPQGARSINTGLQSVAGSNSPATKTYTLTAYIGTSSITTSSQTISVYNDNTPNNFTVPDQINLEPNTLTTIIFGPVDGIDMRTSLTAGSGAEVSTNNINWSGTVLIQNNQTCYVRAFSPPFNTDPTGLTNSATFSVTVGTVQKFFTLTTRAPDVNETFNYSNKDDYVPNPDIDTIPDPDASITNQSNPYIVSDTLLVDDVELANPNGVEIKVDNPNAQVRVKRFGQSIFGPWEDVRSI